MKQPFAEVSTTEGARTAHRKRNGAYYTPDNVVETLVNWAVRDEHDCFLDPSCGDGRFLARHRHATGVEHDPTAAVVACQRVPSARIHVDDFFRWAEHTHERFECAAGNPPFIRYQQFSGETRARAIGYCRQAGARFSALSSSWAPFLVATATLLKPGGRMAFVVPAEIGHAPYAVPLLEYLADHFAEVSLIAIRETIFPDLSQDAWLLFADGFGGWTDSLGLIRQERFRPVANPGKRASRIGMDEWRSSSHRLRRFLLPEPVHELYAALASSEQTVRFGSVARAGIGYVTGANDFFHLRPSHAERLGIPDELLQPAVRNGRTLPSTAVTKAVVRQWHDRDDPYLLLRLSPADPLPTAVRRYLDTEAGTAAREAYKCRNRSPWYAVPDVTIPDGFLSYMSGDGPALVANAAACACTNSVHAVRLKNGLKFAELQSSWHHPLTRLSTEVEGHPLGGGMLKLEPGEVARVVLPHPQIALGETETGLLEEGIREMRRWRHYE